MDCFDAIKLNKKNRLNWKTFLGKSLNRFVSEEYTKGKSKDEIIGLVASIVAQNIEIVNIPRHEIAERIEIGVSARISEMKTERTGVRLANIELERCVCKVMANLDGSLYVFVSDKFDLVEGDIVLFTLEKTIHI